MAAFSEKFVKIIALIVTGWFIIGNIAANYNRLGFLALAVLGAAFGACFLKYAPKLPQIGSAVNKINSKSAMAVILILGIIFRFYFLRYEFATPSNPIANDPATFFNNAKELAATGHLLNFIGNGKIISSEQYFAMYPYEMNYTAVLALSNKIFGAGHFAVIFINTLLDIIAAFLFYGILKKILPSVRILGFGVYFLNPFNVIFSVLPLPIIAVNMVICLAAYLTLKIFEEFKIYKLILLGAVLGIGNGFRPIFSVIMIAVILTAIIFKLKHGGVKWLKLAAGLGVMFAVFVLCVNINFAATDRVIHQKTARHGSGWSLYVGSNTKTYGCWAKNSTDLVVRDELWREHGGDMQLVQDKLKDMAFERYKGNGLFQNFKLYVAKALISGGGHAHAMYNSLLMKGYKHLIMPFIAQFLLTFMYVLMFFGIWDKKRKKNDKNDDCGKNFQKLSQKVYAFVLFSQFCLIGLYLSGLFVEVKPRYFTILIPFMAFLSMFGVAKCLKLSDKSQKIC